MRSRFIAFSCKALRARITQSRIVHACDGLRVARRRACCEEVTAHVVATSHDAHAHARSTPSRRPRELSRERGQCSMAAA
jgi:hypothetical protein